MSNFYNPGQVKRVFPYLSGIEWFILGGPATGNEAQVLHEHYPDIKVIGIEPNPINCQFQRDNEFPGQLVEGALWNINYVKLGLTKSDNNLMGHIREYIDSSSDYPTTSITIDTLSQQYGPFTNSFLWIDIEESEITCLNGAKDLLSNGDIKCISAETLSKTEQNLIDLLIKYGYSVRERFDIRETYPGRTFMDILFTHNSYKG